MKRIISILIVILFGLLPFTDLSAQPKKTRVASSSKAKTTSTAKDQQNVSRASLMYPTAVAVPEEVPWRRDIYRSLDLTRNENAALYYPVQPQGENVNLFTLLFRLLNKGQIPAYEYKLDGVEDFSLANRLHFKDMLDKYSIFYEIDGKNINVADADVPSAEVLSYYVKESSYFDQQTATYHSRIVALCPVLHRSDEFSMSDDMSSVMTYPMFWVKIDDIEPYLAQKMVMTSNVNNAARMSMADFFATNHYKGTIYMTTNMQNKSLAQQVEAMQQQQLPDSLKMPEDPVAAKKKKLLQQEQNRIEKQMVDFEKHIWETPVDSAALARKAAEEAAANTKKSKSSRSSRRSARESQPEVAANDSTAATTAEPTKKLSRSASRSARRSSSTNEKKEKQSKASSSGTPRVSARRQRR